MSSWENYILPIIVPVIGGIAVYVSAKLSQRSAADVVEVDSKQYTLDVLKTSLATLTSDVDRAQDQVKDMRSELNTERGKGEEYRAKVDELERARVRVQMDLIDRDKHVGVLERWIMDERPPPPPARPW